MSTIRSRSNATKRFKSRHSLQTQPTQRKSHKKASSSNSNKRTLGKYRQFTKRGRIVGGGVTNKISDKTIIYLNEGFNKKNPTKYFEKVNKEAKSPSSKVIACGILLIMMGGTVIKYKTQINNGYETFKNKFSNTFKNISEIIKNRLSPPKQPGSEYENPNPDSELSSELKEDDIISQNWGR